MIKGDIVLVRFPFSNFSGVKLRPALVLATGNEHGKVCLAFISSKFNEDGEDTLILARRTASFNQTGLKVDSAVRLKKIVTLHQDLVVGRLGRLPKQLFKTLDRKLMLVFKIKSHDPC